VGHQRPFGWSLTDRSQVGLQGEEGQGRRVIKHKARLVAKGFVQRQGVDFEEVSSLVARMELVQLILTVATHEDWKVHNMDVKSAFSTETCQRRCTCDNHRFSPSVVKTKYSC
jgi:hypothetical protein